MRPRIAIAVVPVLVFVVMLGLIWPQWREFYAGLAVGAIATMYVWALDSPPEWIERKRRGRDGERRTERQLAPLERDGWVVVHDVDATYGNFDHVAIGPPGAFLLETKALRGRVTFDADGMTLHRGDDKRDRWRPDVPYDRRARGAAAELQRRLAPAGIRWVDPVVVLWCDLDDQVVEHNGVAFVHGKRLSTWLSQQERGLTQQVVDLARATLAQLEDPGSRSTPP